MHDGVKIYLAPWSSGKSSSAMALKVAVSREFEARLRHAATGWLVVLLFYVHGKHLRSCRDGQLT